MRQYKHHLFGLAAALALAGCANNSFNRPLGDEINDVGFGNATMNNSLIQSGQQEYTMAMGQRFANEVPSTVTFAFASSQLDGAARAALDRQADWIRQFPEVRFNVYGHTDLVGSNAANKALGLRRAEAVVAYLGSRGISRSRLQALVSYGETRPVIATPGPEQQNRRTVTEVSGFVSSHPTVMNGKYAAVIMREYLILGEREHPRNQVIKTQTNPNG